MTTTTSNALVPAEPVFTNAERLALAGFLDGYTGLTPRGLLTGPAPVHRVVPAAAPAAVPGCRHRVLRPRPGSQRPRPGDGHSPGFYRYAVEPGLPRGGLAAVRCAGPELHPAIRGGLRRGGRTGHSECRPQLMDLRSYAERRRRSGITPAEPPTGVADSCSAVASRGAQIRSLSAPRSTGFAR
jgi:hypothetical protein